MQFEYKYDVVDIDDPKEIAAALRTKDFIVMTNGAAQEALKRCVVEVLLGEYNAMDIMSESKEGFYAVLEEKFNGIYDISDAKLELRGEVNDDGYIKMVAIVEKFSRYD